MRKKFQGILITSWILKILWELDINYVVQLFNVILTTDYFPAQWKVSQINMIPKSNKDPVDIRLHRPISLLPIISKLFEKLLFQKLMPVIEEKRLIAIGQIINFIANTATIEQIHRIINNITLSFKMGKYCSAMFLCFWQGTT